MVVKRLWSIIINFKLVVRYVGEDEAEPRDVSSKIIKMKVISYHIITACIICAKITIRTLASWKTKLKVAVTICIICIICTPIHMFAARSPVFIETVLHSRHAKEIEDLNGQIASLKVNRAEQELHARTLEEKISTLKKDKAAQERKLAALKMDNTTQQDRIAELEEEAEDVRADRAKRWFGRYDWVDLYILLFVAVASPILCCVCLCCFCPPAVWRVAVPAKVVNNTMVYNHNYFIADGKNTARRHLALESPSSFQ